MPDLESRLRDALRSHDPDDAIGRRLAAAIPDRFPTVPRHRRASRWLRPALGVAGLAILVALFVALLVVVDGRQDADDSAAPVPPLRYAILERPQTAKEATARWVQPWAPLDQSSLRDAGSRDGFSYLIARFDGVAGICIRRIAPNDAVIDDCAAESHPGLRVIAPHPESADAPRRFFGLVPDAITAVEVNGQRIVPQNNVWNAELAPDTAQAVIDFRTDAGVIADWREELPLDPRAANLLSEPPRLGVDCRPGAPGCDRVGLAVWLREPVSAVSAVIDGRSFDLDDPTWSGPARDGLRRMFAGFLEPAGLDEGALKIPNVPGGRWEGSPPVEVTVTIKITTRDGSQVQAQARTSLGPGWG